MNILKQAAKAAYQKTLAKPEDAQRYSIYPVHEQEFWAKLFDFAKNPATAKKVLDEICEIENEPCIENDRVFNNARQARTIARLTLLN